MTTNTNYLQRSLQEINKTTGFDAVEEDVAAHGLSADSLEYVVVLDRGIKGSPKYRLPLKTLPRLEKPGLLQTVKEAWGQETESAWPSSALMHDDDTEEPPPTGLYALPYRELQALAKEAGIPANQTSEELIAALQEAEDAD